jgi:hypothetical protein
MTSMRIRAAALTLSALCLTAMAATACSSSTDPGSLPSLGTQAPNSPPGTLPPLSTLPTGSVPSPSGDASACAGAPYQLAVRTASGEDRTITEASSWALYGPNNPTWLFVSSDADLPAESLRSERPDPAGHTLVVISLYPSQATSQTLDLKAGDTFAPSGATSTPDGKPVVDVQVRTATGEPASTGALTGSVTVDAVTAEGVCLAVDLHRDSGSQVKGRIAAPFLSVNPEVLTP